MIKNVINYACILSLCIPSYSYATGGIETSGGGGGAAAVKDSADKTKSDNASGANMSYIMSGMEIAIGTGMIIVGQNSMPPNAGLISAGTTMVGMGLMSAAQGAAHNKSANQAAGTGLNTDGYGNSYGINSDPLNEKDSNSLINKDPTLKAAKSNLAKLEKLGIYDPKAGTLKAGDKTYKVSDFASAGSMAAAGLPKGAIDGAMAMNAGLEKKAQAKLEKIGALTSASGFDEGGAGGRGNNSSADSGSPSYASGNASGAGLGRDPSSLAGMQKNYNGEPIGVAADDIFNMMSRRYKTKESQDSFFTEAELSLKK